MKRIALGNLLAVAIGAFAVSSAYADVDSNHPVKDSYITTKVKAELAQDFEVSPARNARIDFDA